MLLRATSAESWLNSAAMLPQSQRTSAMGDSTQRALRPAAPRRAASGRCPRSRPSLTARALLLVCTTGSTSSLAPPAIHPRSSEQRFSPRSVRAGQHRTAPLRSTPQCAQRPPSPPSSASVPHTPAHLLPPRARLNAALGCTAPCRCRCRAEPCWPCSGRAGALLVSLQFLGRGSTDPGAALPRCQARSTA